MRINQIIRQLHKADNGDEHIRMGMERPTEPL